jgi:hypothetical protein
MSSRWDQKSYNDEEEKMSLFSYELLKGLSGAAGRNSDNLITFNELYMYIKENVWNYSINKIKKEQDPVLIPTLDINKDLDLIKRR